MFEFNDMDGSLVDASLNRPKILTRTIDLFLPLILLVRLLLVGISQKKVAVEFGDILLKASYHFLNKKGSLICELVF